MQTSGIRERVRRRAVEWAGRRKWSSRLCGVAVAGLAGLAGAMVGPIDEPVDEMAESVPSAMNRSGQPAVPVPALEFSLVHMERYLELGRPSEMVRDAVLSAELAEVFARDGRAHISDVLDYAHEVVTAQRSRRSSRNSFFTALRALNDYLDRTGHGYFVHGTFAWDDDFRRVERVVLNVYTIMDARRYRIGSREITALHVTRVRGDDRKGEHLGFTSADHPEVLVMPARVAEELDTGLWPATVANRDTALFSVAASEVNTPWYRQLRRIVADVLTADMAALLGLDRATVARYPAIRPVLRAAAQRALIKTVVGHELQHQNDFDHVREAQRQNDAEARRPGVLFGPFRRLA
ncbi:MAG: hypothetical protein AAGC55_29495, partial [Myxococcota bacterium]